MAEEVEAICAAHQDVIAIGSLEDSLAQIVCRKVFELSGIAVVFVSSDADVEYVVRLFTKKVPPPPNYFMMVDGGYGILGLHSKVPKSTHINLVQSSPCHVIVSTLSRFVQLNIIPRLTVTYVVLYHINCTIQFTQVRKSLSTVSHHQLLIVSLCHNNMVAFWTYQLKQQHLMLDFKPQVLKHHVIQVKAQNKKNQLLRILREFIRYPPVLIYCNTQQSVETLVEYLQHEQFHAIGYQKKKKKKEEEDEDDGIIDQAFRQGYLDIVVALSVLPENVYSSDTVVLYDMPHALSHFKLKSKTSCKVVYTFLTNDCAIRDELSEYMAQLNQPIR